MKKKILILLSLIVLLSGSVCIYAEVLKVLSASIKFSSIIIPVITHKAIDAVSSIDRILNAKISVDFGSYSNATATAKINYYINGDQSQIKHEPQGEGLSIKNNEEFFIELPEFLKTADNADYQIVVEFRNTSGEVVETVTFPSGTDFQHANFLDTVTKDIVAASGGTVEFKSGNQQYTNTSLEIAANALSNNAQIIIKQLPIDTFGSSSSTEQIVALYRVYSVPESINILAPIKATFYYGVKSVSTEFVLKYKQTESDNWEDTTITQTDLQNKTVISNISNLGYYGIFEKVKEGDKSYRPKKRAVVKGRDVFKFNGLQQGDSVKIYTTSGKKIREISSGDLEGFKWDGRTDSGDWAKSGIYVYQIKVKGKLISGTIVFVK